MGVLQGRERLGVLGEGEVGGFCRGKGSAGEREVGLCREGGVWGSAGEGGVEGREGFCRGGRGWGFCRGGRGYLQGERGVGGFCREGYYRGERGSERKDLAT